MPNSIKRQVDHRNVIYFPVCESHTKLSPQSISSATTDPDIPSRKSNDQLIRAYLTEVKTICLRIETLMAMNDMTNT